VGKDRGIADGCDYPWRNPTLCNNKDLANPPISTEHCDWLLEYLDTKHLAQGTGLAGTEPRQNSFTLVVFYTTKTLMPVIGHKMLLGAKNIHCARMMQTVTFH